MNADERRFRLVGHIVAAALAVQVVSAVGLELGSPCESPTDCAEGQCSDGVCCESSCEEGRCDIPGFEGLCIPIAGPEPGCEDDRDCSTGYCRDGVCCESACDQGRCDVPGFEGICVPIDPQDECAGDCDGNGVVTMDELVTGVSLAMGVRARKCPAADLDRDGRVTVAELVRGVLNALHGCAV